MPRVFHGFKTKPTGRPRTTHCKKGHEFTSETEYWHIRKDGRQRRSCAICRAETRKKRTLLHKDYCLKRNYGISLDDYYRMLLEQNGKCYLCHIPCNLLYVDHNHATGKVRKLLCKNCNFGLGSFKENPQLLRLAALYCETFNVDSERSGELVPDIKTDCGYVEGRDGCF